jgi:MFS family permease
LFIVIILFPSTLILLRNFKKEDIREDVEESSKTKSILLNIGEKTWSQREIIKNSNFYFFAPTVFFVGFTLTALFFFQTFIADFKGWNLEWMAINITAYAAASFAFSILAGPIIDKLSAKKVFPFILLPMVLGIGVIIIVSHPLATTFFWFLVGISAGLNPTVSNALYAEVYGIVNLGSVRSLYTFVMVASTAMGPVFYSLLMDKGLNFNQIHLLLIIALLINSFVLLYRLINN